MLAKDGRLWTWGARLGAAKPAIGPFDQAPFLLWKLPPEVRRSLGSGPDSSTDIDSIVRKAFPLPAYQNPNHSLFQ
jgi:hypothetical protein